MTASAALVWYFKMVSGKSLNRSATAMLCGAFIINQMKEQLPRLYEVEYFV